MINDDKIAFCVHGVSDSAVTKMIDIGGELTKASVPCFEVEFVTVEEYDGSFTRRFIGAQRIQDARLKYTPGSTFDATFAARD